MSCVDVVASTRFCFGGGSLSLVSAHGSGAVYQATRIADADALPVDDALDWAAIGGQQVGDTALPSYDPEAADALAQGRDLVEAVSAAIESDEDGSLAAWLATYLTQNPSTSPLQVTADAGAVPADDGWYLLTSTGKRPLLAWVDGAAVTLGDKSDTPTLDKQVDENGVWSEVGTYGSGHVISYRLVLSVPDTSDLYSTYKVSFHDEWDAHLTLVPDSLRASLVTGSLPTESADVGDATDISDLLAVDAQSTSFVATIANLCETAAQPGDFVVLTYQMTADALHNPGAAGLANTAWATYPDYTGEGETPKDSTVVHTFQVHVNKTDPSGAPLGGAVFALRDAEGAWLSADGSFGEEAARATFVTDDAGATPTIPNLRPGSYTFVELAAPEGYALPDNPETAFIIEAALEPEHVEMTVQASGAGTLESLDAEGASFTLAVINQPDMPGTPGNPDEPTDVKKWLAKTGDALAPLVAALGVALVAAACIVAARRRAQRR